MDARCARLLQNAGVDLACAHARFDGDEALFLALVTLYLEDKHFDGIVAALDEGDVQGAFKHAHALKGAAGNLSLSRLHHAASATCELLRAGEAGAARASLPKLARAHNTARRNLKTLKSEGYSST